MNISSSATTASPVAFSLNRFHKSNLSTRALAAALLSVVGLAAVTPTVQAQSVVYAWGQNTAGQLGDGTTTSRSSPVQVRGVGGVGFLTGISSITGGLRFAAALGQDGSVYTWGENSAGSLGDGTVTNRYAPVQVLGVGGSGFLSGVTSISGGAGQVLALTQGGSVYSWGSNSQGELGINSLDLTRTTPTQVLGVGGAGTLSNITAVAGGFQYSLALGAGGSVYSWGFGTALGNGGSSRRIPGPVLGVGGVGTLTNITAIAAGNDHALALRQDGSVYAWGRNVNGPLGDGTTTSRNTPVQVVGVGGAGFLTGITAIGAGSDFSLAVGQGGTVYAWGNAGTGQLGNGAPGLWAPSPVIVAALNGMNIVDVEATRTSCFALSADGRLWAWGGNGSGQLGLGNTAARFVPTEVPAPAGLRFTSIAADSSSDFVLAQLSPIPAPGAAALVGLAGLVAARRRRTQASSQIAG